MTLQHFTWIVIYEKNLCTDIESLPGGANHKRGFSSFGNSDDDIIRANTSLF